MPTIWNEDQVTLTNLCKHFQDSGLKEVSLLDDRIRLYTPDGFYHAVFIDEKRKFLRINTYLPTDKARPRADKLELIQRYNSELFLPSFSLDGDDDVIIDYSVSYETGLLIGQFMLLLKRFGSMIGHVVEEMNEDDLICFHHETGADDGASDAITDEKQSDADEPLQLDGSRPKGVILN